MWSLRRLSGSVIRYIRLNAYPIFLIFITILVSVSGQQDIRVESHAAKTLSKHLGHSNSHDDTIAEKQPLFPEDLFTLEQRRSGAIIFHIMGEYCVQLWKPYTKWKSRTDTRLHNTYTSNLYLVFIVNNRVRGDSIFLNKSYVLFSKPLHLG